MAQLTRAALTADIVNNIYTNTQKRIKGNTAQDRFINVIDSMLIKDEEADVAGGYLKIGSCGYVDISFIKAASPLGKFLRDDGTWAELAGVSSARTITINGTTQDLSADRTWTIDAVPSGRTITINGTAYDLSANRSWTIDAVPTGRTITINGSTYDLSANRSWTIDAVPTGRTITINGSTYDLSANRSWTIDAVPTSRTITINGTTYDLSANRSWTVSAGGNLATVLAAGNNNGGYDISFNNNDATYTTKLSNLKGTVANYTNYLDSNDGHLITRPLLTALTQNYLTKANSTGQLIPSLVYDNGSSVGIGTASPSYKLDVVGSVGENVFRASTNTGRFIRLESTGVVSATTAGAFTYYIESYPNTTISNQSAGLYVTMYAQTGASNTGIYSIVGTQQSVQAGFTGELVGVLGRAIGGSFSKNIGVMGTVLGSTVGESLGVFGRADYYSPTNYGGYFYADYGGGGTNFGIYAKAYNRDPQNSTPIGAYVETGLQTGTKSGYGVYSKINGNYYASNQTLYGVYVDSEISGSNKVSYGAYILARNSYGAASGETNSTAYGIYVAATNANNNYAIVTAGGRSGFGIIAPTAMVHIASTGNSTGFSQLVQNSSNVRTFGIRDDGYPIFKANNAAIANADLNNAEMSFYLNEAADAMIIKAKYAGGTVKTGVVYLT